MDRRIEKKPWLKRYKWTIAGTLCGVSLLSTLLAYSPSANTSKVERAKLTISTVQFGNFEEYVPVTGLVEPEETVLLDVVKGGRVEELYVDDGQAVKKGDLILRLSNDTLVQTAMTNEVGLIENLNTIRKSRQELITNRLTLKADLTEHEYKISKLKKDIARWKKIREQDPNIISESSFEALVDELAYRENAREILLQRIEEDDSLRTRQLREFDVSIAQINENLVVIKRTLDSLNLRAPIAGQLSTLRAKLGKNIREGENIGQIDVTTSFKVRAKIDQFYISKVSMGQIGKFVFSGATRKLVVKKIYPDVVNEQFEVDFEFADGISPGIRPGQSLQIDLALGSADRRLLVDSGAFYRSTGGSWVFRVDADGKTAHRQNIQIGRQNPRHFEVLSGLSAGDKVITSDYGLFEQVEVLSLK